MRRRVFSRALLFAASIVLTSCALEKTYKLELIIETRSSTGVQRWSGVYEITRSLGPNGYDSGRWRGEAIPIDVGNQRFVYSLPIGSDHRDGYVPFLYLSAFGDHAPGWGRFLGRSEVWPSPPETNPIVSFAPMMVRFADDADPSTLAIVSYDKNHREIAPGVFIEKVLVKRTSKPLNFNLVARLPWLRDQMEPYKLGPPWKALSELPNRLYPTDFIRGAPGHKAEPRDKRDGS